MYVSMSVHVLREWPSTLILIYVVLLDNCVYDKRRALMYNSIIYKLHKIHSFITFEYRSQN